MGKILIVGVGGFVGKALYEYLGNNNKTFDIYGVDLVKPVQSQNFLSCNINSRQFKAFLTRVKPDIIFHLAGRLMSSHSQMHDAFVVSTRSLCENILNLKNYHPRVVIPGSAAEYGRMLKGRRRISENDKAKALSTYGKIKLKQTEVALTYAKRGLDVVVARIFNILGPGQNSNLAPAYFVSRLVSMQKDCRDRVLQTKGLDAKRDYLDIEDVCRALFMLSQSGRPGELYNICSSQAVSMKFLLYLMIKESGVKGIVIKEDKKEDRFNFPVIGSNIKLRKHTLWQPKVELKKSIKKMLDFSRKHYENSCRA